MKGLFKKKFLRSGLPANDQFVKQAILNGRVKFPAEDKIRIVMEGILAEVSVVELWRHEGIHSTVRRASENSFADEMPS